MEPVEIEALKRIFLIINERINGLTTLKIFIKQNKDGNINVNYSTSIRETDLEHILPTSDKKTKLKRTPTIKKTKLKAKIKKPSEDNGLEKDLKTENDNTKEIKSEEIDTQINNISNNDQ